MNYCVYFRAILSSFLLCCLIFTSAVFYQIGVPTESSRVFAEIYATKSSLANSIKTPKLVIISGSNTLFGISCKLIQEQTKFSCVNAGTHAGLGIDYILKRGRSFVKPGDIVLLPLEYLHYESTGILVNTILIDFVLSRDPQYLSSIDFITQARFIAGISFERLRRGITAKTKPEIPAKIGDQRLILDEYGDAISNREIDRTDVDRQTVAELKPLKIGGYLKSSYGMNAIQHFVDWCTKNHIKVIATWPSTVWFDVYNDSQTQDFFRSIEDFYKSINVPVVGNFKDFMYDKSMFFDTIYHLNDQGMKLQTRKLINFLNPYLAAGT